MASYYFKRKKFTSSSKTTELPVLLDGGAHPVDLGVAGDGGVVDVDHDHLVVPGRQKLEVPLVEAVALTCR